MENLPNIPESNQSAASATPPPARRNRGGRPVRSTKRKLDADLFSQVERLAAMGITQEGIAQFLEISERTIRNWKKMEPQFYAAIKRGKARGEISAASKLVAAMQNGEAWAICFYLKCQHGWNDRPINVTTDNVPSNIAAADKYATTLERIFAHADPDDRADVEKIRAVQAEVIDKRRAIIATPPDKPTANAGSSISQAEKKS